jgi:glycine cleavage system H protein
MTVKFSKDHEWIDISDHEAATVGITVHAQDALGDVVFVDLPEVGKTFTQGDVAGVVESVKAAADVYMPVTGEIVEVNEALRADPSLANTDPLGAGWFFKVHVTDMMQFDALMDEPAYAEFAKNSIYCSPRPGALPGQCASLLSHAAADDHSRPPAHARSA